LNSLPDVTIGGNEPLYNIGVVSRMTGISMATLRAWERRYGFPKLDRTQGGHRLYSERDILRLRWVKERIDQGMQTAQSINALRHQEQVGNVITAGISGRSVKSTIPVDQDSYSTSVKKRLLDALKCRNVHGADDVINEALAFLTPDDVIMNVFAPVLNEIGEDWYQGILNVATEHLATNYLRQRLMMWMLSGPPTIYEHPIVLACAPDELHEGSLLILGAILRRHRYPVAYLGQSVPLSDLAKFIQDLKPALVVLVSMTEDSAARLVEWPDYMPEVAEKGEPVIGYGGKIFVEQPEWRQKMLGVYLGSTLHEGIETIEKIIR
jgi:DNA-binding transcriptional MerR regulator